MAITSILSYFKTEQSLSQYKATTPPNASIFTRIKNLWNAFLFTFLKKEPKPRSERFTQQLEKKITSIKRELKHKVTERAKPASRSERLAQQWEKKITSMKRDLLSVERQESFNYEDPFHSPSNADRTYFTRIAQ